MPSHEEYFSKAVWPDVIRFLGNAKNVPLGYTVDRVGNHFLEPDVVIAHFVKAYPKHEEFKAELLARLKADKHLMDAGQVGKVCVPFGSPLDAILMAKV